MLPRTLCLLVLGALLLWGCDKNSESEATTEVVFRHALEDSPISLDPAHAATVSAKFLAVNLYDTLYRYKYLARPYKLVPNLATSMPQISPDGLEYTIQIQAGTYFQDDPAFINGSGREVTAADFIYSIKRQLDPQTRAQGAWLWVDNIAGLKAWSEAGADYSLPVSGLQAPARHTIKITLNHANPHFTHALAQGFAAIVPVEAISKWGREFSSRPVGSGPFQLASFNTTQAVLLRNKNYREDLFSLESEGGNQESHPKLLAMNGQKLPLSDRIELLFIKDDGARWNALESDDVDSILAPATLLTQILTTDSETNAGFKLKPALTEKYELLAAREAGFVRINFNMDDANIGYSTDPAQNQANHALRCAIRKSYNWKARNQIFSQGTGQVFAGIIPPIVHEFDPKFSPESIRHDITGARELLHQHGWNADNLPMLTYGYSVSVTQNQMFEQFRGFLIEIGYPVEKIQARKFANFGDFLRALHENNLNIIPSGWEMDYPDASDTLQLYYGPNRTPGSNHANFNNPEYDRLFRKSRYMPQSPERTTILTQLNQIVADACVTISGLARTRIFIWSKRANVIPDRAFTGGYFLRFATLDTAEHHPQQP